MPINLVFFDVHAVCGGGAPTGLEDIRWFTVCLADAIDNKYDPHVIVIVNLDEITRRAVLGHASVKRYHCIECSPVDIILSKFPGAPGTIDIPINIFEPDVIGGRCASPLLIVPYTGDRVIEAGMTDRMFIVGHSLPEAPPHTRQVFVPDIPDSDPGMGICWQSEYWTVTEMVAVGMGGFHSVLTKRQAY